jgi:2-polyprenyl-3-methyl-5-hydroxy-6-metoxy-1,4-benzoquinol methylase
MEELSYTRVDGPPLWQQKLDNFIQNKLADPTSPHRKRWVERPQEYNNTHTQSIIKLLQNEFNELSGVRVIDFGCGSGLDAINLARTGATVTGVEVSTDLIEIARLRAQSENVEVDFLNLDSRSAWQRMDFYDAVIAVDVLEHVEDPNEVFKVCQSILRPGGILILTTPNRWALQNIMSDPHWQLFGVTLLPRVLAEPYVMRLRRVLREYDMTEFVGLGSVRRMLSNNDFLRLTDSAMDAEQKLLTPAKVASPAKRKLARIVSSVASIRPLSWLFVWSYCHFFVRTWQVVAKKSQNCV